MTSSVPQRVARALRVLHIEDSELDHHLLHAELRRAGLQVELHRVDSRSQLQQALQQSWDAVVSDYNLPGFSGLEVLEELRRQGSDLPFLLVSGEIGEDMAVHAMRNGASDYLLKNNLARLAPALLHAIDAAEAQRARSQADAELRLSKQRLHELAGHLQTQVEQERAAIAREIHDDVGGSLTALKFDLAWIVRHSEDAGIRLRVQAALETLNSAIEASQRIMHNLRPAILEQGLVAALQWMAGRFERRTGIETALSLPQELELAPAVALVAYRTAQEALTNVAKHAEASRVAIELSAVGGVLTLEVRDNGRGIGEDDLTKERSFGIRGLQERAASVGGWLDLSSGATGTSLILGVPLDGVPGSGLEPEPTPSWEAA